MLRLKTHGAVTVAGGRRDGRKLCCSGTPPFIEVEVWNGCEQPPCASAFLRHCPELSEDACRSRAASGVLAKRFGGDPGLPSDGGPNEFSFSLFDLPEKLARGDR